MTFLRIPVLLKYCAKELTTHHGEHGIPLPNGELDGEEEQDAAIDR